MTVHARSLGRPAPRSRSQAHRACDERLALSEVLEVAAGVLVLGMLFTAILVGLPILAAVLG